METSDAQVTRHLSDLSLTRIVIFALIPFLINASLSIQVVFGAKLGSWGQLVSLSSAAFFSTLLITRPIHQSRVDGQGL